MKPFLFITLILSGSVVFAQQDFEYEGTRRIRFYNLNAKSINIEVKFLKNRHCSVKLIETDKTGNITARLIKSDENIAIDPTQTESFIIIHKKKFVVRLPQEIEVDDDSTIKPKPSRRSILKDVFRFGRVRLSSQSAGGTTTATTITST